MLFAVNQPDSIVLKGFVSHSISFRLLHLLHINGQIGLPLLLVNQVHPGPFLYSVSFLILAGSVNRKGRLEGISIGKVFRNLQSQIKLLSHFLCFTILIYSLFPAAVGFNSHNSPCRYGCHASDYTHRCRCYQYLFPAPFLPHSCFLLYSSMNLPAGLLRLSLRDLYLSCPLLQRTANLLVPKPFLSAHSNASFPNPSLFSFRSSRSRLLAVCSRDFTVPSRQPQTFAISFVPIPLK